MFHMLMNSEVDSHIERASRHHITFSQPKPTQLSIFLAAGTFTFQQTDINDITRYVCDDYAFYFIHSTLMHLIIFRLFTIDT